ncbi:MAG: sigma-70 family RNA polymerase sigma factor [Lachnospiraceae bacterium]|nr:sigma-70 family RNA polymerase sigma factor [Lachnospiraceae bacterium]
MNSHENINTGISECKNLYECYYTMVYRLSLLLLKNTQDAEDAAQTIFLKVMEKQPVFADEEHTRAWLLTVTRNYCRDVQRSFWHKKRTDMEDLPEQTVEPFDRQESLLFEIFQTLPKKQREVVYLYYFEEYSIKEIAKLLERNESTVQSQLFAARKRMKKQFSTAKTAALIVCLVFTLGFGGIAVDAASGGRTATAIHTVTEKIQTSIHRLLSDEDKQIANETVTLPIQVYASDLVGVNDEYILLANERGLLIYDRSREEITAVLDLQQMECNYLNANSIATRIFIDNDKLYLFNETGIEQRAGKEESASLPKFAYICDLSKLSEQTALEDVVVADGNQKLNTNSTSDKTSDNNGYLTCTTAAEEIRNIRDLWLNYEKNHIYDTFDSFYGSDFLNEDNEKYYDMNYSRNSLSWINNSGKNMLSCLVVYENSDYELYTKHEDGTLTCEKLELTVRTSTDDNNPSHSSGYSEQTSDAQTTDGQLNGDAAGNTTKTSALLPNFSYTGDDPVLATICTYMMESDESQGYYRSSEASVYIPAPVIYDSVSVGEDLIVFCNLWSYCYYRNGNTLECESGGESPARLRLHPDADAPGGYEVIEDIRTGDGSDYYEGIKDFCKDYPGMADKYFNYDESTIDTRESIRTTLIRMYVQDNGLNIKYYKDYGWDPVPVS